MMLALLKCLEGKGEEYLTFMRACMRVRVCVYVCVCMHACLRVYVVRNCTCGYSVIYTVSLHAVMLCSTW